MKLNKTQLRIIMTLTKNPKMSSNDVMESLDIGRTIFYEHIKKLENLGLIVNENGKITNSNNIFSRLLSNLLDEDETLMDVLSNEGIPILATIIQNDNSTINSISKELDINISSVYPYIRKFLIRSIVKKRLGFLIFNKEVWKHLFDFVSLYRSYYVINKHKEVPPNAKIYHESVDFIIFSMRKNEIENASRTAFSLYPKYGIELKDDEIYYRIPMKKITIQTAFMDSLRVASSKGKESVRKRTYCFLFYIKNIKHLRKVKHNDLEIMKKIMKDGKNLENFPTKKDILVECEKYDIRF